MEPEEPCILQDGRLKMEAERSLDPLSPGTTFTMSDVDTEIKANYTGGYFVTVADGTITLEQEKLCTGQHCHDHSER